MPRQELCEIIGNEEIAAGMFSLTVRADRLPEPVPGQFVHIKCQEDMPLRRPISVCGFRDSSLRMVFEVRGRGTKWLSERRPGEALDILGPLGKGFTADGTPTLFVGGGIGVPPLLLAAEKCSESYAALGFRSDSASILIPEFEQVCVKTEIATEDGSFGSRGFVTAAAERILDGAKIGRICACGPKVMLKSVVSLADARGIPCEVSMEERMGCGIGACLVCVCALKSGETKRYAQVCREGPVFKSGEVCWDD